MKKLDMVPWPSGRSKGLLVLAETAIALERRLDIEFDRNEDQLGRVWTYGASLESGAVFEMSWRPDLTDTGVSVSVDDRERDRAVLRDVVEALSLRESGSVSWLSPDIIWWTQVPGV